MLLRISHYTQKQGESLTPMLPLTPSSEKDAPPMLLAGQTLLVLGGFVLIALVFAAAGLFLPYGLLIP